MKRMVKVKKVVTHQMGAMRQVDVQESLESMGYTPQEARDARFQGRVFQQLNTHVTHVAENIDLYVVDPEEEVEEVDALLDRGHLVDLE